MATTSSAARLTRRSVALGALIALGAAGTANADITGTVRTPAGTPVPGVTVEAVGPTGIVAARDNADASGIYSIVTETGLSTSPGPFTITASTLTCRSAVEGAATASTAAPVADGAVAADLALDARLVCAAREPVGAEVTGHVVTGRPQFLSLPGARFALDLLVVPFEESSLSLTTTGGRVLGTGTSRLGLRFRAPARPGSYPVSLNWVVNGVAANRPLGSLLVQRVTKPRRTDAPNDVAVVIDTSGVLGKRAAGPLRRRAVVAAVAASSRRGDRVAGIGFAGTATRLFGRTTIASDGGGRALAGRARSARLSDVSGADYSAGFAAARQALSAPPLRPGTQKSAIFITDGPHTGSAFSAGRAFDNSHLSLAINGTGRSWPVCVIAYGTRVDAGATRLLRRIARDTKGSFLRARTGPQLSAAVAKCRASVRLS